MVKVGAKHWPGVVLMLAAVLAAVAACAGEPGDDADRRLRVYDLYESYRDAAFPEAAEISAQEAMDLALLDPDQVVFIDVRPEEERSVSTIRGSVSVDEFLAHASRYEGRLGVAFCTISYRSGELVQVLGGEIRGVRVVNLRGGLLGWVHEGGTLVDMLGEPVTRLHVYGSRWDLAPLSIETVW